MIKRGIGVGMKFLKTWVPWIIGTLFLGTLASMLATALFDWRVPPWYEPMKEAGKSFVTWLGSWITWFGEPVSIVRWWHWILWGALVVVVLQILLFIYYRYIAKHEPTPRDYRREVFHGFNWFWKYNAFDGKLYDSSLLARCPKCGRVVHFYGDGRGGTRIACRHCNVSQTFSGDERDLFEDVIGEIDANIHTGRWKEKVNPK